MKLSKLGGCAIVLGLSQLPLTSTATDLEQSRGDESVNMVEEFSTKQGAVRYIDQLKANKQTKKGRDKEEVLGELAHVYEYYSERHAKGPNTRKASLKEAFNHYHLATEMALERGDIKYTNELSYLAVDLNDKDLLVRTFEGILSRTNSEKGRYLAHIDYADGLAKFNDLNADYHFGAAVSMKKPVEGVEAHYRYAKYLLDVGRKDDALDILGRFTKEERSMYGNIAVLRQQIMRDSGMDTMEVDREIHKLRKGWSGKSGMILSEVKKLSAV